MRIDWYFDVISPFSWLQWPAIRRLSEEHEVRLRPILFAGLLQTLGHKGPAEIPGKRRFTYRHALWRARQSGIPIRFPPSHPFHPIAALRLCIAAGATPESVEAVLSWIWEHGNASESVAALTPLASRLGVADVAAALGSAEVKSQLRDNFNDALAAGVFGVPSLVINGELFWGEDATGFASEYLANPSLFDDPAYRGLDTLPVGIER